MKTRRAAFAFRDALLPLALVAVLVTPIALRPRSGEKAQAGARSLVLITPHNEAIRHEFGRAFREHHFQKTGERIRMEWRSPGGTSEITRYLNSEYLAGFQHRWKNVLGKPWSGAIERAFSNSEITPDDSPADDTPEQAARRAFLASEVSSRIDLFFGGGVFDFQKQAGLGQLVDSGVVAAHPELFNERVIPQSLGGEPYWDPQGRWIGTCISAFGICYNLDALRRLGIAEPPRRWSDLTDPRYFHEIALANPTQSASVNKTFEMLIQQQMQVEAERKRAEGDGGKLAPDAETEAVRAGWVRAMQMLMRIGANARYFTDASTKIALDVNAGEAAAGMTIDFYGRFQSEASRHADGTSHVGYANAEGGTSFGADSIGLLRGAPEPELAREFIEWVMSVEGQKLWNWKVGMPSGPERYALRRLPILPALYAPELRPLRSDPEVQPYELAQDFRYNGKWTGPLFDQIAFIFRVMCIDPHDELSAAWRALIEAGFPPRATAVFQDVAAVDHVAATGRIRDALGARKGPRPSRIREVQLAKELADHFRAQYQRAAALAQARE